MTIKEKRKHHRVDSINLLNYVYFNENSEEETQGMGRTLNVSETGIMLEIHTPITIGCHVSLEIGLEEDMVDIKGKIIFCNANESGKNEAGIEFFDISPKAHKTLKKYIQAFENR
jgi:c-di-GMP-binding flagellar brake protein YcgR